MTGKRGKERLDALLVERGLAPTRSKARQLIMAGEVLVDDRVLTSRGIGCPWMPTYGSERGFLSSAEVD